MGEPNRLKPGADYPEHIRQISLTKRRLPVKGARRSRDRLRLSVTFSNEEAEEILALNEKQNTTLTETIRTLVTWGLESLEEQTCPGEDYPTRPA